GTWLVIDAGRRLYRLRTGGPPRDATLAEDGNSMTLVGEGGLAKRVAAPVVVKPPNPNDPLIGTWKWFAGSPVTVTANGTYLRDARQAGSWTLVDAGQRRYRLNWGGEFGGGIDDVTLSADGNSLDGKNQFGTRITATKVAGTDPKPKPVVTVPPPPPEKRKPVPKAEELAAADKTIKELFKAEYAKKT